MSETKKTLVIGDLRVTYVARWISTNADGGVTYEFGELGRHEIECQYMSQEFQAAIEEFVKNVEIAYDQPEQNGDE